MQSVCTDPFVCFVEFAVFRKAVIGSVGVGLSALCLWASRKRSRGFDTEAVGSVLPVTEVAARFGVSRLSVHAWVRRYAKGDLGALADRSRRPELCPHQTPDKVEAAVCGVRREHPK